MSRPLIIAIDGPSGAGKSTLGRRLARELGLLYIDTGAMYRAVALAVAAAGVEVSDAAAVAAVARAASIRLEGDPDALRVTLDGRDIGTVVFPAADVKFFLTAVPEERARRRLDEERTRERAQSFEETLADINERDRRDSTRDDSPLRIADDAVVIDTTELSIDEVFRRMLQVVRERRSRERTQ